MNELNLIKLLYNHTYYKKYGLFVNDLVKDNKEIKIIYSCLCRLHEKYKRDISHTELALYILVNCLEKDKDVLSKILQEINATELENTVFEDILQTTIQRQQAYELAATALEVSEGRANFDTLVDKSKTLNATPQVSNLEQSIVTQNLQELYDTEVSKSGLRWRLNSLNTMLGSLRKGNFGFIFARPETGKTTFLASEISFFAQQLIDKDVGPILWFNNEEDGNAVKTRIYQGVLGLTRDDLYQNIGENDAKYKELGGDKIILIDNASLHRTQIEILCEKHQPSCLVIDQIDKIKGFSDDREDLRLGSIYIWARGLAKTYCPVIGVCQADASGEGKKWLTMENVANAKTAKQAEADWMLGIGKTHNVVEEYLRFLHLSKNKLPGDYDTNPDKRHGYETVRINAEVARYEDIQ